MVNQYTRQKNSLLLDDVRSTILIEAVFKVTASTLSRVGVSNPLVSIEFCEALKSGALLVLSKYNYFLRVDSKSGK